MFPESPALQVDSLPQSQLNTRVSSNRSQGLTGNRVLVLTARLCRLCAALCLLCPPLLSPGLPSPAILVLLFHKPARLGPTPGPLHRLFPLPKFFLQPSPWLGLFISREGVPLFLKRYLLREKICLQPLAYLQLHLPLLTSPCPPLPPLLICLHRPQPLDKLTSILSAFLVEGELEGREFGPVFSTAVSFISRADPRSVLNECSLSIEHMNCSGPQPNSMSKKRQQRKQSRQDG